LISENPIREAVAAISVGMIDGNLLLDLDYPEDSSCDADINVVMTASQQLVEIQGTAEGATFSIGQLNDLITLAQKGIKQILAAQQQALAEN
ncbi:RNase PH, partial [Snodgrassella alvi SCGC AB-598-O11]